MKIKLRIIIIGIIMLIVIGCGNGSDQLVLAQQTVNAQAALPASETPTKNPTIIARTTCAQITEEAKVAAAETVEARGTQTAEIQAKKTTGAQITKTEIASIRATQTEQALVMSTAQAQPMYNQVQVLYSDGVISSSGGHYFLLDDFDEKWAQRNWFSWWVIDHHPTNFILRADASYESDPSDKTPELDSSGCGVVFRQKDEDHFYIGYLGMDGYAYFDVFNGQYVDRMGRGYYGEYSMSGEEELMLVVENDLMIIYVNGKEIIKREAQTHPEGEIGLTLLSGTNKGFGTHCKMTNIELWELEQ
jgi:hypothetical protein